MDTWGIPGPTFLAIFGALIVAEVVVGLVWKNAQEGRSAARTSRRLGVYHLAYLAGGRPRVCETAVAALLDGGFVRTNSKGQLTQSSQNPPREPVELAVYAGAHSRRARELVSVLERPCDALADDLAAAGYLVPRAATKQRRQVVLTVAVLVAALGLARLIAGISAEKPVGFLIPLFILADAVAVLSFIFFRSPRVDVTTKAGNEVVTKSRRGDRSVLPLAVGSGVAVAVAVAG